MGPPALPSHFFRGPRASPSRTPMLGDCRIQAMPQGTMPAEMRKVRINRLTEKPCIVTQRRTPHADRADLGLSGCHLNRQRRSQMPDRRPFRHASLSTPEAGQRPAIHPAFDSRGTKQRTSFCRAG